MSGHAPDVIINFLLDRKDLVEALKGDQTKHVLLLPSDILVRKVEFDAHLEDYIFNDQGNGQLRRPWDSLLANLNM